MLYSVLLNDLKYDVSDKMNAIQFLVMKFGPAVTQISRRNNRMNFMKISFSDSLRFENCPKFLLLKFCTGPSSREKFGHFIFFFFFFW